MGWAVRAWAVRMQRGGGAWLSGRGRGRRCRREKYCCYKRKADNWVLGAASATSDVQEVMKG